MDGAKTFAALSRDVKAPKGQIQKSPFASFSSEKEVLTFRFGSRGHGSQNAKQEAGI
jgi:hypothetical protein